MQLPIVGSAPIVSELRAVFEGLFKNINQFQYFQNYLTGLIVLDNKTMANITRCIFDSADKTNLSRFFRMQTLKLLEHLLLNAHELLEQEVDASQVFTQLFI